MIPVRTLRASLVRGLLALVGALAAGLPTAAAQEADATEGLGVLVVAIDALRADHLGCYGYDRPTTPTLDQLAAEGVRFREAFASAPLLVPSHVALFTGCEPYVAKRYLPNEFSALPERRWLVPDRVPRLAVEFLTSDYRTAAFVSDPWLSPLYGFDAGFQRYVVAGPDTGGERSAEAVGELLTQWLRSLSSDESWYAYVHFSDLERAWSEPDPHWEGYFRPRPELADVPPVGSTSSVFFAVPYSRWRGGSRSIGEYEAIYDGHVRKLDERIGRILGALRASGRYEKTLICVVGTFGVQFGEAGLYLRSGCYSRADLRVPWILRVPAFLDPVEPNTEVGGLASLIDVSPTLLELCGLSVPAGTHGVSQAGFVRRPPASFHGASRPETFRRYAFASCGIQEGGAVIGWPRHCLEFLIPDRVENPALRRAWFGEENVREAQMHARFYDRIENPFPPLTLTIDEEESAEFDEFRAMALDWIRDMTLTREVLQANPLEERPVDEATLRELEQAGLIAPDP